MHRVAVLTLLGFIHSGRHTFATLQIAMGTDIYTVSKMLTHKHVSTTEIYADLVSEKKVQSANTITLKKRMLKRTDPE